MATPELRPAIVAFLDILGFGQMVTSDCHAAPGGDVHVHKLFAAHQKVQEAKKDGGVDEIYQFSDSVVVTAKCSADGFKSIVHAVSQMQSDLLGAGILLRGGISYGKQFSSGSFVFSQALIESYRIEKQVAIDPRVIVSNDLLELLFPDKSFDKDLPLITEKDRLTFVDYLITDKVETAGIIVKLWEENHSHPVYGSKYDWLLEFAKFKWPDLKLPSIPRFSTP